ncbi:single-stranded-DNA-specific exonuclease RecJ [Candidatus Dojkabacteria bacterium HGW-Dojkabacteria-1]|uniref:Single-stranded-DNA-specific exonuclease RecJ n=1 Tax=Candidatus Dojkabacteria bacterium HGW-Dojkabacteria-1 TaxID=2013761 RepID=A0A2N2F3C4_9BACT|nr:MAG: single-stranded-DNA-specific exonuclease RecJ [Candidatus Dojkabacteria bacterium HGW-Dojkabacteria-1]
MTLKSKSNWILPEKIEIDDLISFLLKTRNIEDEENFLNPSLESIPLFEYLHDSKLAAKEIVEAVKDGKKILIHGDFDADGISSVSILWEFLFKEVSNYIGKQTDVVPYIPSRIDQGYGLTKSSLEDMVNMKADMLITVDCGVRDKELIKEYREKHGINFVITDHHQPPEDILDSLDYTLVHPMYPHFEYPETNVCGAFVTFLLTQAIRKELGMDSKISEESEGLDLVALATVTDIMPLLDSNRAVVYWGLEQIKRGKRLGLNELIDIAGIERNEIDSYHLGYILGPRINAAGRIGSPLDAVKMLVSDKESVCKNIANILNETNYQRQYMTQSSIEEAEQMIGDIAEKKLLFVVGDAWHEGIVGLVAGKLNEKYHRPVLVGTRSKEGIRGSARSIEGFDITKALTECSEYLDRYGGHEQAAGFTIKNGMEKDFAKCIHEISDREITKEMLTKELKVDLLLGSDDITKGLVEKLDMFKPYGNGNRKPLIGMTDLVVFKKQPMGKLGNHMKLICKGEGIDLITFVMFNCDEDIEEIQVDSVIDVVGSVGINTWNGNEQVQFLVKEWRFKV